jgi:desulfoferrodoxin (superoxide reductase-like protein)
MMIMNKLGAILVLILLALSLPTVIVHANIPTVLSITRRSDGSDTVIDVKVSNTFPSSTHYIESITLDLDGTLKTFTDLTKATANEATYSLNIGAVNPKTIKAQATCNVHGPSSWFTENSLPGTTTGVTGYPFETIVIGCALAILIVINVNRKN